MKKHLLTYLGIGLAAVVIVIIVLLAGSGRLFQGALYNLRPIYTACKIEGQNFNSTKTDDCEHFYDKFQSNTFPDGEYTIFTTYSDSKLSQGMIPVTIKNHQLSCTFENAGFTPIVNVMDAALALGSETVKTGDEIPVGSDGIIVKINFSKNNQIYPYDTNICEGAFQAQVLDANKAPLGNALLDHNGFINSRPLVNEFLLTNRPYYSDAKNNSVKSFTPGNIYISLNAAPSVTFKFTIACSTNFPQVTIPSVTTDADTAILLQGLSTQFLNTCGSKLYLSFQNSNRSDDIQIINPIKVTSVDNNSASYDLKLADLARINDKDTIFPFIYTVQLHLRERSDQQEVQTLGKGVLTINSYTPIVQTDTSATTNNTSTSPTNTDSVITEKEASATVSPETKTTSSPTAETRKSAAPPAVPTTDSRSSNDVVVPAIKVRRSPENIVTLPVAEKPLANTDGQ